MQKKIIGFFLVISIVVCTYLFFLIIPYYLFLTKTLNISIIKTLFSRDSLNTQVNILLLGIAGGDHEGPNLTDTIIVAHYDFNKNKLTTISLPRDIWSIALRDKINSAYAYGGFKLAKAEIQAIINQPIQYTILIDFDEFKNLIDSLGGVDISVENSFIDREFPIPGRENDFCNNDPNYGCRYETISFKRGLRHMDGTTALKFVRSRHAEGDEGTDFARSKRQQQIIVAIKNKLIDEIKKNNLKRLEFIYSVINKSVKRDITNQQMAILAKNIYFNKNYKQTSSVIDEDFFYVPQYSNYNGKYVLVPKGNDFKTIYNFINCVIEKDNDTCLRIKRPK